MTDEEAMRLLVKISRQLSGEEKGPFSLLELAATIQDNQDFYYYLRIYNNNQIWNYRLAKILTTIAITASLGVYLLFYSLPKAPSLLTINSYRPHKIPRPLYGDEVCKLAAGHDTKMLSRLIEDGLLLASGEFPGTVYYPTEKLWEVEI